MCHLEPLHLLRFWAHQVFFQDFDLSEGAKENLHIRHCHTGGRMGFSVYWRDYYKWLCMLLCMQRMEMVFWASVLYWAWTQVDEIHWRPQTPNQAPTHWLQRHVQKVYTQKNSLEHPFRWLGNNLAAPFQVHVGFEYWCVRWVSTCVVGRGKGFCRTPRLAKGTWVKRNSTSFIQSDNHSPERLPYKAFEKGHIARPCFKAKSYERSTIPDCVNVTNQLRTDVKQVTGKDCQSTIRSAVSAALNKATGNQACRRELKEELPWHWECHSWQQVACSPWRTLPLRFQHPQCL